ncbi:MAG TPA: PAS domain S-box protein [Thermoanaerobaculia bacterium]
MQKPRILVVEDESVVAMDIEQGLMRLGYDVLGVASTAAEAVAMTESGQPDLVVMDIRLKGPVDGIAAAQQIHLLAPTPVIFLTANVDEATLKRAVAAEPFGYLAKPFNENDLHRTIELALHKHRAEEAHRREAADALRASEEPFRVVVNAVRDFAIFLLNVDGVVVSWNAGAERIEGYTSDEILGRHFSIFFPPGIGGRTPAEMLDRAHRDGEAAEEQWLVTKDGSTFWATTVVSAIVDSSGRTTGFSMIVRDITERKAFQEQLRVRALQQAGVARLSQSALASRPINELAEEAVALVVECLGVERAAVLELLRDGAVFGLRAGRGWHEPVGRFVMPATREWQDGYSLESRTPVVVADYQDEHRFSRSPLVRTHSVQSAATVAIRTGREPYGVLGAYQSTVRTFTDDDVNFLQSLANILATSIRQQQAEAERVESERRFRAQYQRLPLPTFTFQRAADDFLLVDYNAAAEQLTGGGLAPYIGKSAAEMFRDQPQVVEIMRSALAEQRYLRDELLNYLAPGTSRPGDYDITCSFVPPDFVLLYADEVTAQRRNEAEIFASREQLRSLSSRLISVQEQERKRIAREVHDELGQGLTALKLNVAALAQSLPPAARDAAVNDIRRINDLIDSNIRDVRRIAGELRPTALDDFGLTAAVQLAAENFLSQTGIECEVSIRPEEIQPAPETAIVIYRILQEALTNVVRHAAATRVEIRLRQDEQSVVLEVRDNGSGITAPELARSDAHGLVGMRERAALIGGDLRIEGVPGKGTIVSLRAPLGVSS